MINTEKIQNRHILSLMGIDLWVQRDTKMTEIGAATSRFRSAPNHKTQNTHQHHKNTWQKNHQAKVAPDVITKDFQAANLPASKSYLDVIKPFAKTQEEQKPVIKKTLQNQTIISQSIKLTDDEIRFNIEGIKIAGYIIMVEKDFLDNEQAEVWHNLKNKLKQHYLIAEHSTVFPSMGYADQNLASTGFKGFLRGLNIQLKMLNQQAKKEAVCISPSEEKLIFLTQIPKIIQYMNGFQFIQEFQLQNMVGLDTAVRQQKKDFWQLITKFVK